jgi:hypothetical protein
LTSEREPVSSPLARIRDIAVRTFKFWKRVGTRNFIRTVYLVLLDTLAKRKRVEPAKPIPTASFTRRGSALNLISELDSGQRRLSLVTDSTNAGSLYGGVGTSLILANLLATKFDLTLRIITRTQKVDEQNLQRFASELKLDAVSVAELCFLPEDGIDAAPVQQDELFLATSWWTMESLWRSVPAKDIIYLIQEDERMFYPTGDNWLLAQNFMSAPETRLVNTRALHEHFNLSGILVDQQTTHWFEPSIPAEVFYPGQPTNQEKLNLAFYARPQHARNLYSLGMETIRVGILQGVIDLDRVNLHLIGSNIDEGSLPQDWHVTVHQNLTWLQYAEVLREMQVGLSLMASPHPSYPPLDMAQSGVVVVTNNFMRNKNLHLKNANILAADPTVASLVSQLANAISLAGDPETVTRNLLTSNIPQRWQDSFAESVAFIAKRHGLV